MAECFEEIYEEEILKDATTCSKEALRIILALIAQKLFFCKEKKLIEKFLLCHPRK